VGRWMHTAGPEGGSIQVLLINGTNLFAGTGGGGIFRSSDNGASWTAVNNGLGAGYIYSFAARGTILFAGTESHVSVSTDNGQSWTVADNGLRNLFVTALVVSGTNVFAGTSGGSGGIFFSANDGASWTPVNNGLPQNVNIRSLAVSGANLFAGTLGNGVFI